MPTKRQLKQKQKQRVTDETLLQSDEVAAYLRVSTEEQADSGLGIDAQADLVKMQCQMKDWPEPLLYKDDGVSGTVPPEQRPDMNRLIKDIASGKIKALIVKSLDRTGRTIESIHYILQMVQRYGITFIAINEQFDTSTATGRLCMHMMMILAEFERDNTSERTIAALGEKYRRDGDAGGRLPYGYRRKFGVVETVKGVFTKTVDIEIDQDRAKVVRLIFDLRSQPKDKHRPAGPRMTLQSICDAVSKIAPTGAHGGKWTPTRIKDILAHEDCYHGGYRGDSSLTWPVILPFETSFSRK